jgi:hypothetical protein
MFVGAVAGIRIFKGFSCLSFEANVLAHLMTCDNLWALEKASYLCIRSDGNETE